MLIRRNPVSVLALLIVSLLPISGCAELFESASGTKAGGESLPITLRLGTVESGDPPYRVFIEEFAQETEARSMGAIRVLIDWEAIPWAPESEGQLARKVAAGDIDLALVPHRVFSQFGVSPIDALGDPFLVDSMRLADAVAGGQVGSEMLADLPLAGAVGLTMVPDDLRHPAGNGHALATAGDFEQLRTRTPLPEADSPSTWNLLRALGAVPSAPASLGDALAAGSLDAFETAYPNFADFPTGTVYSANVTFFAKVGVLLASRATWTRLSADQQQLLLRTADDARTRAAEERPTEIEQLTTVCTHGQDAILVSDAELGILHDRAIPVHARLRSDSEVARMIDAISALKASLPEAAPTLPEVCGPVTGDGAPLRQP